MSQPGGTYCRCSLLEGASQVIRSLEDIANEVFSCILSVEILFLS